MGVSEEFDSSKAESSSGLSKLEGQLTLSVPDYRHRLGTLLGCPILWSWCIKNIAPHAMHTQSMLSICWKVRQYPAHTHRSLAHFVLPGHNPWPQLKRKQLWKKSASVIGIEKITMIGPGRPKPQRRKSPPINSVNKKLRLTQKPLGQEKLSSRKSSNQKGNAKHPLNNVS